MYEPYTEPTDTYAVPEEPVYEPYTEPTDTYDIPTDLSNNGFNEVEVPNYDSQIEENNEYIDMPSFMNISQIEENAEDVIKPEKPVADINELLKPDATMPSTNFVEEEVEEDGEILKPGKFFNFFDEEETKEEPTETVTDSFNLDSFYTNNEPQVEENNSNNNEVVENNNNKYVATDIKTGINTIHDCIKTLEKYGFKVNMEELDLNDKYQIMLDIDKNGSK